MLKVFFRNNKKVKSPELIKLEEKYQQLSELIPEAKSNLECAENHFSYAETKFIDGNDDSSYVDVAILNKASSEKRYSLLLKELKVLKNEINKLKEESKLTVI